MISLNYLKANCEHFGACLGQRLGVGERNIHNCYLINSDSVSCVLCRVHLLFPTDRIGLDFAACRGETEWQRSEC